MRFTIGPVELQKRAGQSRGVVCGHADIGQMRRVCAKNWVCGRLAHIADQSRIIA